MNQTEDEYSHLYDDQMDDMNTLFDQMESPSRSAHGNNRQATTEFGRHMIIHSGAQVTINFNAP